MIRREYYYHYNNTAISGTPEKKGGGTHRRLIGSKKQQQHQENNNNDNTNPYMSNGYDGQPTIVTSDGFGSSGAPASGNKPVMRSKWDKHRTLGKGVLEQEEDRKRADIIREFSGHCKALRDNPSTHLVDYSERIIIIIIIIFLVLSSLGVSRLGVEKNDYEMSYIETC